MLLNENIYGIKNTAVDIWISIHNWNEKKMNAIKRNRETFITDPSIGHLVCVYVCMFCWIQLSS